jgi:hypothetical protein
MPLEADMQDIMQKVAKTAFVQNEYRLSLKLKAQSLRLKKIFFTTFYFEPHA